MHRLLNASIAESSNRTYESGWNQWVKFCGLRGKIEFYNPTEHELLMYVAWLSTPRNGKPRGLAVKTVRCYLAAMAHYHALEGHADPKAGMVRLKKELTGLKRWRGTETRPKRPITISLLKEMKKHVRGDSLESKVHWAVMCMGVHGLFRLGELLPPPASGKGLLMEDLKWVDHEESHATVRLRTSKTDPYGKGAHVHLFATGCDTCPIAALKEMLTAQREMKVPMAAKTPLLAMNAVLRVPRKEAMISVMKKAVAAVAREHPDMGLESKDFSGHSLRRGGATSLALRGVRESVLRLLGRWVSDAVNLYIALPVTSLKQASKILTVETDRFRRADLAAAGSIKSVEPWLAGL
jgi:hypothetical protein